MWGCLYTPQGSKYSYDDPYTDLQHYLVEFCTNSKYVLLFGDINSRCKTLDDFTFIDNVTSDFHDLEQIRDEDEETVNNFLKSGIHFTRNSVDKVANNYG